MSREPVQSYMVDAVQVDAGGHDDQIPYDGRVAIVTGAGLVWGLMLGGELPARYAIAVDSRDVDAWLSLFIEDVDCGKRGRGREVLRSFIEPNLRTFYRSIHQVCGHEFDVIDEETATGTAYCRAEHEYGDEWIGMAIVYFDRYVRRDGRWYFERRQEMHW